MVLAGPLELLKLSMIETVSKMASQLFYLPLILLPAADLVNVCHRDVMGVKLAHHGIGSKVKVLLLVVKRVILLLVFLILCLNVNIMFLVLNQTVLISNKLIQPVEHHALVTQQTIQEISTKPMVMVIL